MNTTRAKEHTNLDAHTQNVQRAARTKVAVEMFNSGVKSIEIAETLGVSPATIHCDLKRAGVNLHAAKLKQQLAEAETVLSLALTGAPAMEVVEKTGFSRTKVDKIAKKYRINFRRSNARD